MTGRMSPFLRLVTLLLALGPVPAAAHDWYPVDCCSGHDCFPIADGAVEDLGDGRWRVRESGAILPAGKIRVSQDGRRHLCTRTGTLAGEPLCGFDPPRGF